MYVKTCAKQEEWMKSSLCDWLKYAINAKKLLKYFLNSDTCIISSHNNEICEFLSVIIYIYDIKSLFQDVNLATFSLNTFPTSNFSF